jgi:hypothetical protein
MRYALWFSAFVAWTTLPCCATSPRGTGAPSDTMGSRQVPSSATSATVLRAAPNADASTELSPPTAGPMDAGPVDAGPADADAAVSVACALPPGPFAGYGVGTKHVYLVKETVATHGIEEPYRHFAGTATFTVDRIECAGAARVVYGAWTLEGDTTDVVSLPDHWLLDGRRVTENAVPSDQRTDFFDAAVVMKSRAPVCQTSTSDQLYGRGLYRICVDARGFSSVRAENFAGPRTVTVQRK